jgi:hypothetical protein
MALPLCVSQVVSFIVVQSQTQLTLITTNTSNKQLINQLNYFFKKKKTKPKPNTKYNSTVPAEVVAHEIGIFC